MQFSDLVSVIDRYSGATVANAPPTTAEDFKQVSQYASPEHVAAGLAEAFHSDQTPPFSSMVANLFENSNGQQRAAILDQLLGSLVPASGSSGNISGVLSGLPGMLGSRGTAVTPEEANQISSETVEKMAEHAQTHDPSIVEQASRFYAQHPTLVQALGAGALALVIAHMSRK
jgi:hypothetical protein